MQPAIEGERPHGPLLLDCVVPGSLAGALRSGSRAAHHWQPYDADRRRHAPLGTTTGEGMPAVTAGSPSRSGSYGVDAPKVPALMLAGAAAAGSIGVIMSAPGLLIAAALLLLSAASFL